MADPDNKAELSGMMKRKLLQKMSELDSSMEKITGLSKMMGLNYHKAPAAVNLWMEKFQSASPHRHLTFVYVANDVLQNTRRMGKGYIEAFSSVLSLALCTTVACNPGLRSKVNRLVQVWGERNVVPSAVLNNIREELAKDLSHYAAAAARASPRHTKVPSQPATASVVAAAPSLSPGTPPGTPPPECIARSRLLLQSIRSSGSVAAGINLDSVLGVQNDNDDSDDGSDGGSDDGSDDGSDNDNAGSSQAKRKSHKRKRDSSDKSFERSTSSGLLGKRRSRSGNGPNSAPASTPNDHRDAYYGEPLYGPPDDEERADDGLTDALVYNEAVEEMIATLKEQFSEVEPVLLQLQQTLPSSFSEQTSEVELSLRKNIIENAGILKQLKHELKMKEERNNSMITMLGHEIEQQREQIALAEENIQNIDGSLASLLELTQKNPRIKVFKLKREKEQVIDLDAKSSVGGGGHRVLRDDLKHVDIEDQANGTKHNGRPPLTAHAREAAKKRKQREKKKREQVPMVWNRQLRAYIPVNTKGVEMQWRDH